MQKIIKPESGLKEIDEMKSYIHRQKLLYKKLQAEQDDIIKNMERSVQRRDFIKVRYPVDEFGTGNVKQKVNKTKEINDLMEQINHINRKKKEYSNKITNTKNQVNELNNEINQLENESFNIQTNAFDVRNNILRKRLIRIICFVKRSNFKMVVN